MDVCSSMHSNILWGSKAKFYGYLWALKHKQCSCEVLGWASRERPMRTGIHRELRLSPTHSLLSWECLHSLPTLEDEVWASQWWSLLCERLCAQLYCKNFEEHHQVTSIFWIFTQLILFVYIQCLPNFFDVKILDEL